MRAALSYLISCPRDRWTIIRESAFSWGATDQEMKLNDVVTRLALVNASVRNLDRFKN